jgi:peptidylprolyl isomerase
MTRAGRNNILLLGGAGAALCAFTLALAAPRGTEVDFTVLPPGPAEVEQSAAEKRVPGHVSAASYLLDETPPVIEVTIYADGRGQRVLVDAGSGAVQSVAEKSRFPGMPVTGDWTETASGVLYYDIQAGPAGPTPDENSSLQMRYELFLVDGTSIVSTFDAPEPQTVLRNALLPGWIEGVGDMTPGSKRKLILPGPLAFGENAQGGIPPNALVIVDMELVGIDPYAAVPDPLPGDPVSGEPVVSATGLQHYDITVGDGPQPKGAASRVKVHYTGWLNDGTKFDSSYDLRPGQTAVAPAEFGLNEVIRGWTEGVGTMRVGGKRKLIVPYDLAYGAQGDPRRGMPPKATLTFDVELIEIVKD